MATEPTFTPFVGPSTGAGFNVGTGAMPPGPYASPVRPTEPTAGGEELARLEHLAATILDHTAGLEVRLERILAQPAPTAAPTAPVDRPARSDGAPGSPLAEQLHVLNDGLAAVARRLAELADRIDI